MKKNDIIKLNITSLTGGGDGIGHAENGITVFVPNTAVGDVIEALIIKAKKNYCIAKLQKIITPSKNRIESDCDISNKCGGCVFRHITYRHELEIKKEQVKNSFKRIGKIDAMINDVQFGDTHFYRNKAQFPIGIDKDGKTVCGFYTKSSHRIVPCDDCKLQPQIFNNIISVFCEWADKYNISKYNEKEHNGALRHLYIRIAEKTNEIMVVIVANSKKLEYSSELVVALQNLLGSSLKSVQLNVNTNKTNVVLGGTNCLLFGEEYITDIICNKKIRISSNSFYQVNRTMAEKLYTIASDLAEPENKVVLDLYCGAGAIGLSMADKAKSIIGVEIVPDAVDDAIFNAQLNNIHNAEFICGDAKLAAVQLKHKGISPDVVILDPPRKGCDAELLKIIANDFLPKRVVYISCNDSTLARDAAIFNELGYKVKTVIPVDLFARTGHVEMVALFENFKE